MSIDSRFKPYVKKSVQMCRPYEEGEDLSDVSVWQGDLVEVGGMIGINADDHLDQWYIAKAFFDENYIGVPE